MPCASVNMCICDVTTKVKQIITDWGILEDFCN